MLHALLWQLCGLLWLLAPHTFTQPPLCSPPVLQYCKERYGGMREYMQYIGFTREQQARLARSLTNGDW